MGRRRDKRLSKARRAVTSRRFGWRINALTLLTFLLLQGALVAWLGAFAASMIGEPFFENGRFKYLAAIDTSSGEVALRPPVLADGSYETFVAWTSEARMTCTPFVYAYTLASDVPTAGLVGDSIPEAYAAWARAEGLPTDIGAALSAPDAWVGTHLTLPVRTLVCIRGGAEPLGYALSGGLLQQIADAVQDDEPRLSKYLRANEQALIDAYFESGALLANSYVLPVLEHPTPAIAWRAIGLYALAGALAVAVVWLFVLGFIRAIRVPRKRWKLPKDELVCPRCACPSGGEQWASCPECGQRIVWPTSAPT